jgi:hypothetical protein
MVTGNKFGCLSCTCGLIPMKYSRIFPVTFCFNVLKGGVRDDEKNKQY